MPQLKVIRASAGSGKTHTLSGEFLRLLFTDADYFRHILAVTFTNKATNEMKSRIVRELHLLSSGEPSSQVNDLIIHTGLSENEVREKANTILKRLLHHYSNFSVSTIDAFFQRIIRSFTRELGLQGTYSIELDTESLLTEVIDQLLIQAETDKSLLAWLVNYAESLIEKGDSWNLRQSIRTLGKEIFREEFKSSSYQVAGKYGDRNFLNKYRQELHARFHLIGKEYRDFGYLAKTILQKAGLESDDFFMKSKGPVGFLLKLVSGEFIEPTSTAKQAAANPEKWFTKQSLHAGKIRQISENELMPLMQRVLDYYNKNFRDYFTLEVILKNIFTLGILSDLSRLAYRWCNDNNAFLLPEAPVFLHRIIDGNDTPFIYEKAGYWYHHFMIDEFQDTSLMQWLNFKPLISNSLSQDYDNLVVGDVKQSIYRWRNSNWTILAKGIDHDFPPGIIHNLSLRQNWRSGKRIIEFNNWFFQDAAVCLEEEFLNLLHGDGYPQDRFGMDPVTGIYADTRQEPGNDNHPDGKIRISFIEEDDEADFNEKVNQRLINLLNELQKKGYNPGDIAIITRKNKEAKQVADFLLNYEIHNPEAGHRFPVISDEALRLGGSSTVVFLISLLKYLVNPDDLVCTYYILLYYKNNLVEGKKSDRWLLPDNSVASRNKELAELLPDGFFELTGSAGAISLAEITERLISIFRLAQIRGEQVYLNAFRDLVHEYGEKNAADPGKFLEYWDDTGKEKSVSALSGQEAIRIFTVHKAKGLEFKIVILPYCNWELNTSHNSILWCKPEDAPFNDLDLVPVAYSSRLKKTVFAGDYYTEFLNQYTDNLNLLYVSYTRACNGLFVFCKKGKEDVLNNVSVLVRRVLRNKFTGPGSDSSPVLFPGCYNEMEDCYSFGDLPEKVAETERSPVENIPPSNVTSTMASQRIQVAYQGRIYLDPAVNQPKRPLNKGKILHEIFTSIRTKQDIIPAINKMYLHGKLNHEERDNYITQIAHLMNDVQVLSWFMDDWYVLAEAEIILPEGISRRPDRVMIKEEQVLVIDYKFGEKTDPSYHRQVEQYIRLLKQMGYMQVQGFIWYVMMGKVAEVSEK